MTRIPPSNLVAAAVLAAALLPVGAGAQEPAPATPGPRKALAINDPVVTNFGVRVRVAPRFIEEGKREATKILGKWSEPVSVKNSTFFSEPDGFNTLLDPGYDVNGKSAGGVRTTPLEMAWSWRTDCATGGGLDGACKTPREFQYLAVRKSGPAGSICNQDDIVPLNTAPWCNDNMGDSVAGGVACNQRGVPAALQTLHKEHGFYVTQEDHCYYALVLCTWNSSGQCGPDACTHPQRNELGSVCELDPLDAADLEDGYATVAVHIFPNGFVENAGGNLADARAWMRPWTLRHDAAGDYFGYVPTKRYGVYTGVSGNPHGYRSVGVAPNRWAASNPPPNGGSYTHTNIYDELYGSYFRPGDDTAFYANTQQMQIHSVDRDAVSVAATGNPKAVAGCGEAPVYTGQTDAGGDPLYFYAKVPQCLRPKSYWDNTKEKWVACNAYDTFNLDGSLNPARDDAKVIYPGDNAANVCGTQVTAISPLDSGGKGTGWSGLRISTLNMNTNTAAAASRNAVDFVLAGDEWRLESAIWLDFATECQAGQYGGCGSRPGYQIKRRWAVGSMMIQNISVTGKVKLLSLDDHSCTATQGDCGPGDAANPWGPQNDGLMRPDRFRIDLNMPASNIAVNLRAGEGRFKSVYSDLGAGGTSCLANHSYAGCLIRLGSQTAQSEPVFQLLIQQFPPEFQKQFYDLIHDQVAAINESLPNLSAFLNDPWNFGNALIDVGLFLAGGSGVADPTKATRNVWEVDFLATPGGGNPLLSANLSLGFRPIAFRPPNGQGILAVDDPSDGIQADSFFGVPTLIYPDTSSCQIVYTGASYTPVWVQTGASYTYNNTTGNITGFTPSAAGVRKFFVDTSTGQWAKIDNLYTVSQSGITAYYLVEPGRSAGLNTGAWGVSDGWLTLPATVTVAQFANLRVGDLFWHNNATSKVYTIIGLDAANKRIRLDLDGAIAHRLTPIMMSQNWTIKSRRCSRPDSLYASSVTDQQYDYQDYVLEGTFNDARSGQAYNAKDVIKPYWALPVTYAPSWCMSPTQFKADADALATRFPKTTWLSFDATDLPPAGSGTVNPSPWARNTLGLWETIPGNATYGGRGVVKQNQNDPNVKETVATPYDFSVHVHQRTLNQLAQVVIASGAACLEFAATDPDTGDRTPWADFLTTDRFAAFIPELQVRWPNAPVKLRLAPQKAPRIRTGVGTVSYPAATLFAGSASIVNEPYTIGAALPDLQLSVVVTDPVSSLDMTVFRMNWNAVVGLYLRAMRQCNSADPMAADPKCASADTNIRTITGYWQLFVDYGSASLESSFEPPANTIDGFQAGRFSNSDFATTNPGEAKFEVLEANCGLGCNQLGFAQSLATLLDSAMSLYLDTRASTDWLQIPLPLDVLYVGPDGPNDDALGASTLGSRGDYLAVYARKFGALDLVGLMGALAPGEPLPEAAVPALEGMRYVNTNAPVFATGVRAAPGADLAPGLYTYRLDGGFWRTPRADESIRFAALTEGKHVLEMKSLAPTDLGMRSQDTPTQLTFVVDTLAPEVHVPAAKSGTYRNAIAIEAADLQTPDDALIYAYAFDGGEFKELAAPRISLRGVAPGRHTLRVRAVDQAGNAGVVSREVVIGESDGCGGCGSRGAEGAAWFAVLFALLTLRRHTARRR